MRAWQIAILDCKRKIAREDLPPNRELDEPSKKLIDGVLRVSKKEKVTHWFGQGGKA